MIDLPAQGVFGRGRGFGDEIHRPEVFQIALVVDEIDEAAANAPDRRDLQLTGNDRLHEGLGLQRFGALDGGLGVIDRESDSANRRAVVDVEGMGETALVLVDHHVDAALPPERDILGAVTPGDMEAERPQQGFEPGRLGLADGKFDEFDALDAGLGRQGGWRSGAAALRSLVRP